jgi:F0F1-type ATP synthase delta subunit
MRIVSIIPRPESQCVDPTLGFDLVIGFQRGHRLPVELGVQVRTEDKKFLGVARPITLGHPERLGLETLESSSPNEVMVQAQVSFALSSKQVDYLDGLRSQHRKRDVVLECSVEVQFLVSKIVNGGFKLGPQVPAQERGALAANTEAGQLVVYQPQNHREPFHPQQSNMWLLSGDGGRTYLEREALRHAATVVISSGDWLHDYVAPWRTTRYLVVELPQPELLTASPNIEQRVNAAIEAGRKAADNVARGEWNDVIEDLRPVWELLRNHPDLTNLLQRDGYTPDAIAAFTAIVQQQFTLASKFLHRLDQSGQRINPELSASKEDAFVCYSCAMSFLHLIARKAARLN